MVDGRGDPNTSLEYADAVTALYTLSYTLKFASKRELNRDYVVMPLEALWWARDMDSFTVARDKASWMWTVMILVPDWIPEVMHEAAAADVARKKRPPLQDKVRLETLAEGRCVTDPSRWLLRRRGAGARADAHGVHPSGPPDTDREASRDLPQRPAARSPRQNAHNPKAASCAGRRVTFSRRDDLPYPLHDRAGLRQVVAGGSAGRLPQAGRCPPPRGPRRERGDDRRSGPPCRAGTYLGARRAP